MDNNSDFSGSNRFGVVQILCVDGQGWKWGFGGKEYLFPSLPEAHSALTEIFESIEEIATRHNGTCVSV